MLELSLVYFNCFSLCVVVAQLLTEMVHQRDVARLLVTNKVSGRNDFGWVYHLRFYWNPKQAQVDTAQSPTSA